MACVVLSLAAYKQTKLQWPQSLEERVERNLPSQSTSIKVCH